MNDLSNKEITSEQLNIIESGLNGLYRHLYKHYEEIEIADDIPQCIINEHRRVLKLITDMLGYEPTT